MKTLFSDNKTYKIPKCPKDISEFTFKDINGRKIKISFGLVEGKMVLSYKEVGKGLCGSVNESRTVSYQREGVKIKRTETDMRDRGCLKRHPLQSESFLTLDSDEFISSTKLAKQMYNSVVGSKYTN